MAVFVVLHIGSRPSKLPGLLNRNTRLPASFAQPDIPIRSGRIYVAPPDHHMLLETGCIRLSQGPKVRGTRPAVDPLFQSAATAYGEQVVGVILSGADSDGAAGLRAIQAAGGLVLVQRPDDAAVPSMPLAAIIKDHPDACLPVDDLARRIAVECCGEPQEASQQV
jgi:two-component system, chemotaxis family, protein-glutamate methylesterase/glutaminase